jgi:hypothetical protein
MAIEDPVCWRSPGRYIVGLDLGQSNDPTAVCVLHTYSEREDPTSLARQFFDVRHLQRLPLGLSYPVIVQDVITLLQRPPLAGASTELVIDQTGVGAAVGDIFAHAGLKPIRVVITGGTEETQAGSLTYNVPKGVLISTLDARLHTSELRFAKDLREAPTMESELKDFRRHVSEAGRYSFEARTGKHDDLVLATAIALWRAVRKKERFDDDGRGPGGAPRVIRSYERAKAYYSGGPR